MKKYGHISDKTNDLVKKAGFQIIKDDHGDYEVAAGKYESCKNESLEENLDPNEQNKLDKIVFNHLTDAAYEAEVDHELDVHRKDMEKAEAAFNDDFYFGSVEEDTVKQDGK